MELYLSLGSNLGDRLGYLRQAVDCLWSCMTIDTLSPVYETVPWGPNPDQPFFLNACIGATTTLPPKLLLGMIKQIERALGRSEAGKWGPHEIDIDLLFYGDWVTNVGSRTIPHRQIRQRPFVLFPLADIAPDFTHPVHNLTIADLLTEVDTSGVTRIPEALTGTPVLQVAL